MKNLVDWCCDMGESQEDKFTKGEGKSLADGLAAAVPARQEHERPYTTNVHKPVGRSK